MKLKIKTLIGKDLEIDIDPEKTILDLKNRIEETELIPFSQQKLVYNGKILVKEDATLHSQNLQNGNVIHMVIALRGG